jgi:hypothetical protein
MIELEPVAPGRLRVTRGAIAQGEIRRPTVRAVAVDSDGEAAELRFELVGTSETYRALASGGLRRQLGLKLRAADTCNVIYVMWRIAPAAALSVQVKYNPGKRSHVACGADGYHDVAPTSYVPVAPPSLGSMHALRAAIRKDELTAWIDDAVSWRGVLPDIAHAFSGPVGLRTDNVQLAGVQLLAPRRAP